MKIEYKSSPKARLGLALERIKRHITKEKSVHNDDLHLAVQLLVDVGQACGLLKPEREQKDRMTRYSPFAKNGPSGPEKPTSIP